MILDQIIADTRKALEEKKQQMPFAEMKKRAQSQPAARRPEAVLRGKRVKLIAEVKKASPSKGVICPDFDPVKIARVYAQNGAAAISVLTEPKYFQGRPEYLKQIAEALGERRPPLLRKDFIFDDYQVYESRAYRADWLLLIAAVLTRERLEALLGLSHELGMACLVEVHDETQAADAVKSGARIIGINNRDLTNFTIDLNTTARLRALIPPDRIVISESGIASGKDVAKLRGWGVDAVLVGEALMSAPDIAGKMKEFL